jgi:aryl-alcohol dehydrogenase-like predicted oxidoreductase
VEENDARERVKRRNSVEYRTLGKTGIKISEIGFGAWGIGGTLWQGANDDESIRALHRAVDLGLNFIDTALVYGDGHSENLVGTVLKERTELLYCASKIPPKNGKWPARPGTALRDAFPYDHIIKSTEMSLKNLGLDRIDVQQFHVWDDEWAADSEWQDAIASLKEQEKIRFFGISLNDHQPENALKVGATGLVDSFQVIYNIFDQSPEKTLFPLCKEKNIGIIVRVPLDEGGLTGKITPETTFPSGDFRNRYFRDDRKQQVAERTHALAKLLGKEAVTLPELALRYCLHHPVVSTVIPGMRNVANVEANCRISNGRKLSDGMIEEIHEHKWERNFYS